MPSWFGILLSSQQQFPLLGGQFRGCALISGNGGVKSLGEMARYPELASIAGIEVFFAEPHHPWQRPSNEAFNGLLRRYVGKGPNLAVYSQTDLHAINHRINTMPRRIHNWQSAANCYHPAVVAATA